MKQKQMGRSEQVAARVADEKRHESTTDLFRQRALLNVTALTIEDEIASLDARVHAARKRLKLVSAEAEGLGRVIGKR
jgi:hypothetical protein